MAPSHVIDGLRDALKKTLPGHDGFRELSGYARPDLAAVARKIPPPKESAVLILLYPVMDMWHTLLMLRPTYSGVHSGQVAFPGGHREPSDADIHGTALREFTEETGAKPPGLQVLGQLTQVYIPPSDTLVTPVLAYADELGPLAPDPREVAGLIPVAVSHLLREDILKRTTLHIRGLDRDAEVPYWDVDGHIVWGATALMIAELRQLFQGLR